MIFFLKNTYRAVRALKYLKDIIKYPNSVE